MATPSPPLSRRSSATWTARTAAAGRSAATRRGSGSGWDSGTGWGPRLRGSEEAESAGSAQGYMSYTGSAPDRDSAEDLRPAANPRSGCRPAWIRVLQVSAAAGDEYDAPHSACYVT